MTKSIPFNAILWDMDGVIADTFDNHFRAWKRIFDELGHPFSLDDFTRTFGMNNRLILHTLLGYDLPEEEFQKISDRKEIYFREDIRGYAKLLPGVTDWLQYFEELGMKQAVASSAPQANIDALVDELGIHSHFQAEASGAVLRGKPDPAVFLLAAKLLDAEPQDCLVIEDAVAGVEAARRAGMKCVAVLTTNPAEKLSGADVIVKDLTHLKIEMLQGL
jgi:beta-phosphoglucomutase family hydrolase